MTRAQKEKEAARFRSRFDIAPSGCWLWRTGLGPTGYGAFSVRGVQTSAHRASWIINMGRIPKGKSVLHKCDVRNCVNPEHLFLGTQLDNVRDMHAKGRARKVSGDSHWTRVNPERLARGDASFSRRHPERLSRGDSHWTRKYPGKAKAHAVRGDRHGRRVLSEADVLEIRAALASGCTAAKQAKKYSVSDATISHIKTRKNWGHI